MIQYLSAPKTPELIGELDTPIFPLSLMMMGFGLFMMICAIVLIYKALTHPYWGSRVIAPVVLFLLGGTLIFIARAVGSSSEPPQLPLRVIVIGAVSITIVIVSAVVILSKNPDTRRLKKEQRQREIPIIRISHLRGQMEAHHNGPYTEVMVHRADEVMLTAPAFFDTSLPEAIAYEQAKREAAEALEGWDSDTAAPAEQIVLVDRVFTAWSDFVDRACDIGLNGLTQRDVDLLHEYTEALSHGWLSTNEYRLYLKNLIKLYDKIQYGDSDDSEPPVERRDFLNRRIKQRLSGRAITSHAQFTRALTPSGGHMRTIEK